MIRLLSSWSEPAYSAMRAVTGFLFLLHGLQKLFGAFGGRQMPIASMYGAAGLIETVAGTLILLGIFTSLAAFISSGEMAFAYFISHYPRGGMPVQNEGEMAVALCFVFLYIATQGDGIWSVQTLVRGRGVGRLTGT
jgi:putative oxidoreductase